MCLCTGSHSYCEFMIVYVELVLHPWDETYSFTMYDLDVFLNSVCKYFPENFCVCVHRGHWSYSFLLSSSLPDFGIMVVLVGFKG